MTPPSTPPRFSRSVRRRRPFKVRLWGLELTLAAVVIAGTIAIDRRTEDAIAKEQRALVTMGVVTDRQIVGAEYRLGVKYWVGGRQFDFLEPMPADVMGGYMVGDPIAVRYLPEAPYVWVPAAVSPTEQRRQAELKLGILALLLAIPAVGLRLAARREARVLRDWNLYPARVLHTEWEPSPLGRRALVEVEFTDESGNRREWLSVPAKSAAFVSGGTVNLLCDPQQPERLRLDTQARFVEIRTGGSERR